MAGYVSPDDILKGVTSSSNSNPVKGYVSPDDIIKSVPQAVQSDNSDSIDSIMGGQHQLEQSIGASPQPFGNGPYVPTQPHDSSRDIPIIGPILKGLDYFANSPLIRTFDNSAGKAMGVPDNMMNSAKSTGSPLLDKVAEIVGGTAGYLTNPAQIEQNVGQTFFGNQALQNAGSKVSNAIESRLPNNFATRALANAGEQATIAGLGSAAYAPFQTLNSGQDLKDIPKNMLEQGLMGAALGGAGGALGSLAKSGYKSAEEILRGTKEPASPSYDGIGLTSNVGGKPDYVQTQPSQYVNAFNNTEPISPKTFPPINKLIEDNGIKPLSSYTDTLYRESSPQNALDLIPGINSSSEMKGDQVYFSNNKDLALGQGTNKGVMIEFSPGDIQGHVNTNKPTWQHSYNNGDAEFVGRFNNQGTYKDAVKSVTIQPDAKIDKVTKMQLNRALSSWEQVKNPDGSVSYLRPKEAVNPQSGYKSAEQILNSDGKPSEPIKLTPAEIAQRERIDKFSQVESNPQIPNTADQIQSKTGKESVPLLAKANEAYIKGVDNLHRMNQFDQQVKDVTGGSSASDSTYKLALNSRGSDMISRQILEKNLVDSKGNVIGDSLKSVAKAIPKGQQSAFEDYLVAKHSITRMGRGETVYAKEKNMTIQKAQAIVDNYEKSNPKFKEVAQKYYDYNNKLGQAWLVDTGILSQKQWDGYREANPYYVPNNRIFTDLEKQAQFGSKRGFANQTNPVKKAEGSQRQIVSPIESTIENTAKYVKTGKQNEVAQTLYRNLQKDPEAFSAWGEVVHDQPKTDVNQMLHDEGIDGVLNEITKSFEQKPDLTKGNIVSALVDGQRVHMRIHDPQLLEALTNLSPHAQNFVMDTVGKVTNTMKVLTTGLNPVFGLTRNIFRDIPHAFIASKTTNNPLTFSKDLVQSILSVLGDGKLYNDFKNFGGGHSSSVAADRNLLAQTKEKLLPSNGLKQSAKRIVSKPFHALENLNNAVESAPRLAEFKRTQNGTYDSKIQALYNANDVTTNFNKFGNYTKQADQLFPYLNAAVQGLDQLARMFRDNPTATLTKATATLTMPAIAIYFMNHGDPNYNQASNFTKDNYFLIPKGDGTFWKVAKPRELGMVFSTGVERVLRAFADHDPKAFQDFGNNFLQNFLPPGVSGAVSGFAQKGLTGIPTGMLGDTIAGPIQSLASNKDFANRDIVPRDLAQLSPRLQYDAKTSDPAKFIGNMLNSSPKQLDYLAKSYGGVLGQLGIPLTTKGGSLGDTLKQQVTTDPTFSNDISRNFYDQKAKADMAKADAKSQGDSPPDNTSAYYDRLAAKFSKIRLQQKQIQNDSSLNKSDKQKQIKELQQMLNELQAQATQ